MNVAILQANLGNFDNPVDPVKQDLPDDIEVTFHRWTDDNFPPITGLTPRMQYRIPKTHGWQMFPDHDIYVWLDGTVSFKRADCMQWYLDQLGDHDFALFKHPNRRNIRQEVEHITEHLKLGKPYITPRYKNGLHQEQYDEILATDYKDRTLYASTMFVYRNTPKVQAMLKDWWYYGCRYFTVDQIVLPWLFWKHDLKVKALDEPIYKSGYISLVSHHR